MAADGGDVVNDFLQGHLQDTRRPANEAIKLKGITATAWLDLVPQMTNRTKLHIKLQLMNNSQAVNSPVSGRE